MNMLIINQVAKSIGGRERQTLYLLRFLKSKSIPYKVVFTPSFKQWWWLQYIVGIFRLFIATVSHPRSTVYIMTPTSPGSFAEYAFTTLPYIFFALIGKIFRYRTIFRIAYTVEYERFVRYIPQTLLRLLEFHSITSIPELKDTHKHIFSVLNGVDVSVFKPYPKEQDSLFTFGYVGRFKRGKNLELIIRGLSLIPPALRKKTRLLLIGYDTERIESMHVLNELMDLVNKLKINSQVSFIPLIPLSNQKEMARLYSSLDVSILASTFEGTANAIMESLACGVPTITFAYTQGTREVLDHCPSWYFEKLTPESISQAMITAMSECSPAIKNTCREYAVKTLDLNKAMESLASHF